VESETLHLKRLGMSFQRIAEHLVAVAQEHESAVVPIPEELRFPPGYSISPQAVHRAFRRALMRLPNLAAAEFRKLDTERCEDFLLSLQPGIRKGDPRSIEVGVKVLAYKAEINGYKAPAKVEMTAETSGVMSLEDFRKMCDEADRKAESEIPKADGRNN
jgi:hypothetical protein